MRLSEAIDVYLRVHAQQGFSRYTLEGYRIHCTLLMRDIGDVDLSAITLDTFRNHIANQTHLKITSIACKVRSFRSMFKWFHEEGYIDRNPTLKLREPKLPKRVPKALTIDEVEMLRDACHTPLEHALVELFFSTGCRLSEIHRLNLTDIDWDRKSIVVFGKGSVEREVYFGAKASIWLRRYLDTRKDSDSALFVTEKRPHRPNIHHIQWWFRRIAKRCNLEHRVTPHTMRHTFATLLLNQGAPLAAVQSLCGHSKPETTMIYAHLSGVARQQAFQRYFVQ